MEAKTDMKLAVLIDADNVPYAYVKEMFEEIAKYGTPTFKRIYADWTKPTVSGWKKILLENAIIDISLLPVFFIACDISTSISKSRMPCPSNALVSAVVPSPSACKYRQPVCRGSPQTSGTAVLRDCLVRLRRLAHGQKNYR